MPTSYPKGDRNGVEHMAELWELGIADLAAELRAGSASAVDVVDAVLARMEDTEGYARAWVFVDAASARARARDLDEAARRGQPMGSLHGIPLGVKDVIDVQGMPTEAGSASLAGQAAALADAGVVRRLRENGAIFLGKTVTHEFAFGQGTPPSRNPWDPSRYAGGSSVGSGVAVAVGSASGTIGTDTGGSVRNPAAVNGLIGLKPSSGLVDGSGVLNVSHTLDQIGPIARSAADCEVMLRAMVAPDVAQHLEDEREARAVTSGGLQLRVAVDRMAWDEWGVSDGVRARVNEAIRTFEQMGVEVVELALPNMSQALPASLAISLSEAAEHHRARLKERADRYLPQTRVMLETGALVSAEEVELAREVGSALRSELQLALSEAGVSALLSPTLPVIAPLAAGMVHELTAERASESLSSALLMLSPANLTGMPGLSIPCGFELGQPVGLHLLGRLFTDSTLLHLAQLFEDAAGWQTHVPITTLPDYAR